MQRARPTTPRAPMVASIGLLALTALGPLGCPADDVIDPCADGGDGTDSGCIDGCTFLAGDLVISEIVANVEGADAGLEWFEIYNASGDSVELEGLTLIYEKTDGSGHKSHVISRSLEVPAGGYVVVGSLLDEIAEGSDHVDYGYGGDLGELGNSSGYLAVECDGGVIDEAYYTETVDTASRTLDGSQAPDAIANNDPENWCDSKTEFYEGFAATPGAANDPCGGSSTCGDGEDVIHPAPGDLVITEVLPNPDVIADTEGEWFEIHSLADTTLHLNGLDIGKSVEDDAEDTIASLDCLTIEAGEYVLIARSDDPELNGDLPSEAIKWTIGFSLTNDGGGVWIGLDGEVLDAVTWNNPSAGEATQLDPGSFDPIENDDLANWCDATDPFNPNNLGTPGAANNDCPPPPPGDGECYENGELRDIVYAQDGDIEVYEVMPDPDLSSDTTGEWFELRTFAAFDLNELELGKDGEVKHTVDSDTCLPVAADEYVVFARGEAENCDLPNIDYVYDNLALNNGDGNVRVGVGGAVFSEHAWASSSSGAALSYDPALMEWCDATVPYGCGDLGTPGEVNTPCGDIPSEGCIDPDDMMMRPIVSPVMGELTLSEIMPNPNGAPDASGEWFELHASAACDLNGLQLGKGNAVAHTVTSNMCIELTDDDYAVLARSDVPAENCDLPVVDYVYDGLSLTNNGSNLEIGYADVIWDEHAWVNVPDGGALSYDEMGMIWCDAVDPFGCGDLGTPDAENPPCGGQPLVGQCFDAGMMAMRDIVTPAPGDLIISEFMANPALVVDNVGEWFELRAFAAVDINGLELGRLFADGTLDTIDAAECIALDIDDTALLARNGDTMLNGLLPPIDFVFGFGLNNSNSALHIAAPGDPDPVLLDELTWVSVSSGSSTSLDPDDDPALWCPATMPWAPGTDNGSPDADNEQCN